MWTKITRPKHERKGVGYSSDLSDSEWAMIEPRLPHRNRLGRPPITVPTSIRECFRRAAEERIAFIRAYGSSQFQPGTSAPDQRIATAKCLTEKGLSDFSEL